MTTIQLKFRQPALAGRECRAAVVVCRDGQACRLKLSPSLVKDDWYALQGAVAMPSPESPRYERVQKAKFVVECELQQLRAIVDELEQGREPWSVGEVAERFVACGDSECSVFKFIHSQILHKQRLGKTRSAETHMSTLKRFMQFRKWVDLSFAMMSAQLIETFEAHLRKEGLSRNTSSFYLRILRTNYKMAVELGLTADQRPFRHVYCGMDKTVKRSIQIGDIRRIKQLNLSGKATTDYARDMFLFSFYTRGMSFVDMAYLKKSDLRSGYLSYRRKKTGQLLTIEWTEQMQAIVDKREPTGTSYLLPIISREDGTERRQYQNELMKINRHLKGIAALAELAVPLSLYYSRHSWATIAQGKGIPLAVISEALGHDSEITTKIYLDSIRTWQVDKANRRILNEL